MAGALTPKCSVARLLLPECPINHQLPASTQGELHEPAQTICRRARHGSRAALFCRRPGHGGRQRPDHLQHGTAGRDCARTVPQRRPRPGSARLCRCAPRTRACTQPRPHYRTLQRCCGTDRPHHGGLRIADRPQGHQRGRAEFPVRPAQPGEAAAEVHRPYHQRRAGTRQRRRILQRHPALHHRRAGAAARGRRYTEPCRTTPG